MAAARGKFVLERLWDWAKELQLNPEEVKNDVYLLKVKDGKTAWHMAAESCKVGLLQKLWDWAKEIQLNPDELRSVECWSEDNSGQMPWHKAS